MENKRKVSFLDESGHDYNHLILTDSQIRLLDYLHAEGEMREEFDYIIENDIEWKEI